MKKSASKNKKIAKSSAQRKIKSSSQESIIQPIGQDDQRRVIEEKAYELYESRGYENGGDQDDWYEAEKIISSGEARVEQ